MTDLIICSVVIVLQVVIAVSVLRYLLSRFITSNDGNVSNVGRFRGISNINSLKLVVLVSAIIYILLIVFRGFIYSKALTDDLLHESTYLNGVFLLSILLEKWLKSNREGKIKTTLRVARIASYVYIVAGYGFYYLIFIVKLGFAGVLI